MAQIIQDIFINKLEDRFKTTQSSKSKEKLQTNKVLFYSPWSEQIYKKIVMKVVLRT